MDEREVIAERVIWAVDKDGRGFDVAIVIGKPYQAHSKFGEWACPIALIGLHGTLSDIHGFDSWQALTNAMGLAHTLLTFFVGSGGRLFRAKKGDELAVNDLFFQRLDLNETVEEKSEPLPPLTDEQQKHVDELTAEEIQMIDDALMAEASTKLRKVARVVGVAMMEHKERFKHIPDIFYALRVKKLVEEGRLVSEGDLDYIRFSEVKLPD